MKNFKIFISPAPTHQGSLRILKNKAGRMFVGKMSNSKATHWMKEFIAQASKHKPSEPYNFPLEVTIGFEYDYLKKHKASDRKQILPKETRPDLDNLEKMVLDSLVKAGFMVDDSLVAIKHSHKIYTGCNCISIDISRFSWYTYNPSTHE